MSAKRGASSPEASRQRKQGREWVRKRMRILTKSSVFPPSPSFLSFLFSCQWLCLAYISNSLSSSSKQPAKRQRTPMATSVTSPRKASTRSNRSAMRQPAIWERPLTSWTGRSRRKRPRRRRGFLAGLVVGGNDCEMMQQQLLLLMCM